MTNILRRKIIRKEIFKPVSFEELLLATGGYGVARIDLCAESPILDKTLAESGLRKHDIIVPAITRDSRILANPLADVKLLLNDELLCFGKLQNIRDRICMVS